MEFLTGGGPIKSDLLGRFVSWSRKETAGIDPRHAPCGQGETRYVMAQRAQSSGIAH